MYPLSIWQEITRNRIALHIDWYSEVLITVLLTNSSPWFHLGVTQQTPALEVGFQYFANENRVLHPLPINWKVITIRWLRGGNKIKSTDRREDRRRSTKGRPRQLHQDQQRQNKTSHLFRNLSADTSKNSHSLARNEKIGRIPLHQEPKKDSKPKKKNEQFALGIVLQFFQNQRLGARSARIKLLTIKRPPFPPFFFWQISA